jgi:hypothetical protein
MPKLGTGYGGWWLPEDTALGRDSFVVSAGVGEDISFDVALQTATGCRILLLDPTERAARHLEEVRAWYEAPAEGSKPPFTGSVQPDYEPWLKSSSPNWDRIEFKPVGLWSERSTMKFYKQENPAYVSQSLVPGLFTGKEYTMAQVDCLSRIVPANQRIDLLKLDIEGAEMPVLDLLLHEAQLGTYGLPRYLCVEFDAFLKGKDAGGHRTGLMMHRLAAAGYKAVHEDNWNVTFRHVG